ncbi:hypothetical protein PAXINDRAFT_16878 [Paxillus involutus ATCC 200175]|uniref:Uncharacterized protein n=1 Tax=Paxillus involutus ATCC 200175 TaxID=664439 RepID=A0A0C9SR05_PAXIN|nr:hypothetical protein PAXINDRAFT_16878 [Paxillus involutus ATCC 200175]
MREVLYQLSAAPDRPLSYQEMIEHWCQALAKREIARRSLQEAQEEFSDYEDNIVEVIGPVTYTHFLNMYTTALAQNPSTRPGMFNQAFSQECTQCWCSFSDLGAFTKHGRTCKKGKKQLSTALAKAKELYRNKKPRLDDTPRAHSFSHEDADLPNGGDNVGDVGAGQSEGEASQVNSFGLFRLYDTETLPHHDPVLNEPAHNPPQPIGLQAKLMDQSSHADRPFHPYLNESSMLLGNWYWNQSSHSKSSFKKLLSIVGDADFHPEDIQNTNWLAVDWELGNLGTMDAEEWLNEDAGWEHTTISISVPFS